MTRRAALFLVLCLILPGIDTARANDVMIIGTGGVTGVYFPAGGAICRLINRERREHGFRCLVESTDGSIANLDLLRAGDIQFAMAQSDWHYQALRAEGPFSGREPFAGLRSVLSLHPEPVTLVARADSGIRRLEDLPGKRLNLGRLGSGQRATMTLLFQQLGWVEDDFAAIGAFSPRDQVDALCDGEMDAIVYAAGHPNGAITAATSSCDSFLVSLEGSVIDKLVAERPYYTIATIPGRMYSGNINDTATFGVRATLVTRADAPEDMVYTLVRTVFEDFADFSTLHPAFALLDPDEMVSAGLSAPLHPGAARYYRESGFLNQGD